MMSISVMRTGVTAVVLAAAALVQGCSAPDAMIASQQSMVPASYATAYTGPYSGGDWYEALDAAMTSDNGGSD